MLTVPQVDALSKQFKAAKIKVLIHPPREDEDLLIWIDETETVRIEPGKVDIKVFVDPAHRQLVMWADEQARTVKQVVSVPAVGDNLDTRYHNPRLKKGHNFPVSLPEGTTYKIVEKLHSGKRGATYRDSQGQLRDEVAHRAYATVEASVPASSLTFLIGSDEHSQFVCGLPKRVRTVKQSHEALRPPGVPRSSPRQGEWFFVPATAKERVQLEKIVTVSTNSTGRMEDVLSGAWLGGESSTYKSGWLPEDSYHENNDDTSHAAYLSIFMGAKGKKQLYVRGYVVDDRRPEGRKSRHKPLWLNEWHRVVRNLEVATPGQDSETWD